ncbi:MAG: hypothetical protein PVF67_09875, partial [Anaerolineae bacterium]
RSLHRTRGELPATSWSSHCQPEQERSGLQQQFVLFSSFGYDGSEREHLMMHLHPEPTHSQTITGGKEPAQ